MADCRQDVGSTSSCNVSALIDCLSNETAKVFLKGGRRSLMPEQTLARLMPLLEAVGITRIANVTGLDRIGIPVINVCRPNSRSLAVYQGKGATLASAKASGLMESFERYHAEFCRPPELTETYSTLQAAAPTIDAASLPLRKDAHFNAEQSRDWLQGVNLLSRQPVWVPYEIVHFDTAQQSSADYCFASASTGLAAGNSLSEAILHGMCEVIERDCSTLWRLRMPVLQNLSRVDPATIDDPLANELVDAIRAADLNLAVWDTTSEIGIASFICRIAEPEGADPMPYELLDAAGCHPVREVALARAILEAVQGRATMISGARDDLFYNYYEANDAQTAANLREGVISGPCHKAFQKVKTFDGSTIEADIRHVLDRLSSTGFSQVIAVNLTREDIGLPVVRIVIPELEDGELAEDYVPRNRAIAAFRGLQ